MSRWPNQEGRQGKTGISAASKGCTAMHYIHATGHHVPSKASDIANAAEGRNRHQQCWIDEDMTAAPGCTQSVTIRAVLLGGRHVV